MKWLLVLPWLIARIRRWWWRRRFVPYFDFYRLGEPSREFKDEMPVIRAPRGGIRYIKESELTDAG